MEKEVVKISVRGLVEFILRGGGIWTTGQVRRRLKRRCSWEARYTERYKRVWGRIIRPEKYRCAMKE